jgi:hypothetical protein
MNPVHLSARFCRVQRVQILGGPSAVRPAGSAVLWNRNNLLRLRFRLLKSYGSSYSFQKTFGKKLAFLHSQLLTRKKLISFIKFIVKCD